MPNSSAVSAPAFHRVGPAINCLTWLAACALVAGGVNRLLPLPKVGGVHEKYKYFAAHRDRYNLLFIGSSRFYHQIIPERFDSGVAKVSGALVRSFNFGADGMRPPESLYLLRQVLALRPPNLRWVVIEMMEIKAETRRTNARTRRLAYWHDWRHTRLAWDDIARSTSSPSRKWALMVEHGMYLATQSLNLGRGVEWLGNHLARSRQPTARKKEQVKMEGFDPLVQKISAADLANYEKVLSRMRVKMEPVPLHPVFHNALNDLIVDIRAAAAEPIFVITPTINSDENFAEAPSGATLLPFNDPAAYPELFDPANRSDSAHLNEKGAILFTDILASRLAERLAPRQ